MYIFVKYLYKCAVKCKDPDGIDPTCDFLGQICNGRKFRLFSHQTDKKCQRIGVCRGTPKDLWRAKYQD